MLSKKESKIEKYKKSIEKYIVDEEIKKELIDLINFYNVHGNLIVDKNNLYGKYINKSDLNRANLANEFLEIKILDDVFICNCSKWSNRIIINIIQEHLKGGNIKIYKKETEKAFTYNNNNQFDVEEYEKIYNYQGSLVYESKLEKNSNYDTFDKNNDTIVYTDNNYFNNNFELERIWYIHNGSIIKYQLSKSFMNKDDEIFEEYSICPGVWKTEFENIYNFQELNKEIFKKFMAGLITIDEVLANIPEKPKKLIKRIDTI